VTLAHYFGLVGECANFIGAMLLGYDVFSRAAHERAKDLAIAFAKRAKDNLEVILPFVDRPITIGEHTDAVRQIEWFHVIVVSKVTKVGIGFLALGFAFVAVYHILEIRG
jgi:hypothetical protein